MNKTTIKYLLFFLFLIYMLLLSKYILFTRMHTAPENYFSWKHIQASVKKGMNTANLKPFRTIKLMYYGKYIHTDYQYKNLGGNLLGFVPLGIFIPLLFRRLRIFPAVVAVVFLISLGYELIQLSTGLGIFDIDDLILNTTGGIIGFIIHFCATLIYRQPLVTTSP
ncbi:MAG TPA: VanZ family protein [Parafilimonas sp.]|nr:VanZ family protein [Parafilimonas sp.]